MGRVLKSNVRRVLALVGVEDQYSRELVAGLHRATLTQSPMSAGAQGFSNQGLPGDGVNAFTSFTAPLQDFIGAASPAVPAARRSYGDLFAGSLPDSGPGSSSVAWMDLGKTGSGLKGL